MSNSTNFINGTIVQPTWLNDVNATVYSGTGATSGNIPKVLDSLTSLRATLKTEYQRVQVLNTTYAYVASDTTSSDNGLSIIVASDGGRWYSVTGDPGPVLTATQGQPFSNGYQSIAFGNLTVPLINTGDQRFWTANYTLNIPAGATITPGDVNQDHVAVTGHSRSLSVNARQWGLVGLAQRDAVCTTNAQVGQCYGLEADVNNNSGLDMTNFAADGDVCGVMAATGGSNVAKMAYCVSKIVGSGGFYTGMWMRQSSLSPTGFAFYIDDVAPAHGLYYSDVYAGGDVLNAPNAKPVVFRMTTGAKGSIQSIGTTLQFNSGIGGYVYSNAANTTVLATLSNAGAFQPLVQCMGNGSAWLSKTSGATSIDVSAGGLWGFNDTAATSVSAFNNGVNGQRITIRTFSGNTTIVRSSTLQCAGGANLVLATGSMVSFINNNGTWYQEAAVLVIA